jgi:hypothetical protein
MIITRAANSASPLKRKSEKKSAFNPDERRNQRNLDDLLLKNDAAILNLSSREAAAEQIRSASSCRA